MEGHVTWDVINRTDIKPVKNTDGTETLPKIIPSTWAFKIKRYPDGIMKKLKACFCVRGDLQENMFDTYAPVASWTSIRMLTIMALQKKWVTKQIDFTNAFVHAPIDRDVYVSLPCLFGDTSGIANQELCLKLNKSLYGLKDAPKLWADFLAKGLDRCGFVASPEDAGVYLGRGMAIVTYVDDVLFFGPDEAEMEKIITELQCDGFNLKREKNGDDSVYDFLGIHIEVTDNSIQMTQFGLIQKFLTLVGMELCNAKETPCSTTPLSSSPTDPWHNETWEYASAVGMLMYLAGNAYPEIQYAVHQCTRFTHSPRQSHTYAIKRIAHYLKGVLDQRQGLVFKVTNDLSLDCYVDASFAGLWNYEDDQDPVCVKSRTGYVMTLGGCPVHWASKLQTLVALSTCESEYIALAQALRELIPMRRLLDSLNTVLNPDAPAQVLVKSTIFEDNNGAISMAQAPNMTPRTKHIATRYHFVKQYFGTHRVQQHPFVLTKIGTDDQKADIFTKGLDANKFKALRLLLCNW